MKSRTVLKAEVYEVIDKLKLYKIKITENNLERLAEEFGIIKKTERKSLNKLSDKDAA